MLSVLKSTWNAKPILLSYLCFSNWIKLQLKKNVGFDFINWALIGHEKWVLNTKMHQ